MPYAVLPFRTDWTMPVEKSEKLTEVTQHLPAAQTCRHPASLAFARLQVARPSNATSKATDKCFASCSVSKFCDLEKP